MRFNKVIVSLLSLLLLVSFFASNVVAQDENDKLIDTEESVIEGADVISSDEVVILEEDEVEEELPEIEEEIKEIEESEEVQEIERKSMFTITRVTVGEGFVMKDDESDAEFFRGTWIVKRFINKTANLEDIENQQIESKKFGFVVIGVAEEKEKFKIEMTDFSEESVTFDLKEKTGTVVGNMEIKPKRYNRITLWFGSLTLDSGEYMGVWSVTAVSKTKIVKPEIKKISAWKVFAVKQRKEAKIKEKLQERMFEREGIGEFAKEQKGKDISELEKDKRNIVIDKEERIRERIKERAKARTEGRIEARTEARAGTLEGEETEE